MSRPNIVLKQCLPDPDTAPKLYSFGTLIPNYCQTPTPFAFSWLLSLGPLPKIRLT